MDAHGIMARFVRIEIYRKAASLAAFFMPVYLLLKKAAVWRKRHERVPGVPESAPERCRRVPILRPGMITL